MLDGSHHRELAGEEHVHHNGVLAEFEVVWMMFDHRVYLSLGTDSVRVRKQEGSHIVPDIVGAAELSTTQEASTPLEGLMGKEEGEEKKHGGAALAGRKGSASV